MMRVFMISLTAILLSACVGPGPWGPHGVHPPRMNPGHGNGNAYGHVKHWPVKYHYDEFYR